MNLSPPPTKHRAANYFAALADALAGCVASDGIGDTISLGSAIEAMAVLARKTQGSGNKLMFVGNGGSAGIASHAAIDFSKNGGMPAMAFNDPLALTCVANDYGYEQTFAKQIEFHGKNGDFLVAISSSGCSANILNAVAAGRVVGAYVLTLSGFTPSNPLRQLGDMNFFIDSREYGFVEISHLALIHAVLDLSTGWNVGIPT